MPETENTIGESGADNLPESLHKHPGVESGEQIGDVQDENRSEMGEVFGSAINKSDRDKDLERTARLRQAKSKLEKIDIDALDLNDVKGLFKALHSEINEIIYSDGNLWTHDLGRTMTKVGDETRLNFSIENIDLKSLKEYREKFIGVIEVIEKNESGINTSNLCTLINKCESLKVEDVQELEMDTQKHEKETISNRMRRYGGNGLKTARTIWNLPSKVWGGIKCGWGYIENFYKTQENLALLRWFVDKFINVGSSKYWLFPKDR